MTTSAGEFSLSNDGKRFTFVGQTPTQPEEVWSYTTDAHLAVTDTNPQVREWKLGTEREISWKNSHDGQVIHGVVDLPPGYTAGTRYKTIVHVHGGPEEAWTVGWHGNWYNYAAMLASQGYVVLLADPRGSQGQGPRSPKPTFRTGAAAISRTFWMESIFLSARELPIPTAWLSEDGASADS